MGRSSSRAYRHLETNEVMKVQRVNDTRVVVEYPTGPERVFQTDLDKEFEHLGSWEDYQNGVMSCREIITG
jgi:hypothetical protein